MMARLTEEQKELILADFHTGHFSQRKLADKYEVSTATINKLTKGIEPKNLDKVNAQVTINTQLSSQSEHEVNAVHSVVDERTKYLLLFQNSAMKNQQIADNLLQSSTKLSEVRDHATITKTNKETVLGKESETVINNTNAQQTNLIEEEIIITKKGY